MKLPRPAFARLRSRPGLRMAAGTTAVTRNSAVNARRTPSFYVPKALRLSVAIVFRVSDREADRSCGRCSAGFPALLRLWMVLTSATWVSACGKLPSSRRLLTSYSSASRPTSFRSESSSSNRSMASGRWPPADGLAAPCCRRARSSRRGMHPPFERRRPINDKAARAGALPRG